MKKIIEKSAAIVTALALFFAVAVPSYGTTGETKNGMKIFYGLSQFIEQPCDDFDAIYFTDDEFFDLMDVLGLNIERPDDLAVQPYAKGVNKIVRISNTKVDIYLSKTVITAIEVSGVAASVALSAIPGIGIYMTALTTYFITEKIDASCGWIFHLKTKVIHKGDEVGFTYYVASREKQK